MATRVYNQANTSLSVDGIDISSGLAEGASIVYLRDGGEVQKTQGTSGASINIASDQGATLRVTLRETSPDHGVLQALKIKQSRTGSGVTVVIRTGADVLHTMPEAFISNPGEKSTGDKTQASVEYTFMSAQATDSNLEIADAIVGAIL